MGKRTRLESNDYECIAKKFKKLERKLLRARRKHRDQRQRSPSPASDSSSSSSSSSSGSSSASSRPRSPRASCSSTLESCNNEDVPPIEYIGTAAPDQPPSSCAKPAHPAPGSAAAPRPRTGAATSEPAGTGAATSEPAGTGATASTSRAPDTQAEQQPVPDPAEVPELDEELLKILGDDPSQTKIYGKEIRPDLAVRLQYIATMGLSEESRKDLLQKYLPPANSILIDAPTLNPEIKAAINEHVFKRDKSIEIRQKQIASVISSIGESLTLLLAEQPRNTAVIKLLMDASKMVCDCQNAESLVRRNFILHTLNKGLKEEIQTTKIDKFLFSQDLADKLKAAKAINKSGDDLKITAPVQKPMKIAKPPARNLNWRGPLQIHRPKEIQRTNEPAKKNHRYNSSRQSSRPASTSTRNSRP